MRCNKKKDMLVWYTRIPQLSIESRWTCPLIILPKNRYTHTFQHLNAEKSAPISRWERPHLRLLVCLGIIAQPSVVKSNEEVFLRFKTRTGNESTQRFTFQIVVNVFMKPIVKKVPIINYRTAPGPSSRNLRKSWKRSLVVTVSIALFKLTEKNIHWKLSLPPRQCIVTSKTDCWGLNRLIYLRWWVSENGLK